MTRFIRRLRRRIAVLWGGRFRDRHMRLTCFACRRKYHRDIWPKAEAVPKPDGYPLGLFWGEAQMKCGHRRRDGRRVPRA